MAINGFNAKSTYDSTVDVNSGQKTNTFSQDSSAEYDVGVSPDASRIYITYTVKHFFTKDSDTGDPSHGNSKIFESTEGQISTIRINGSVDSAQIDVTQNGTSITSEGSSYDTGTISYGGESMVLDWDSAYANDSAVATTDVTLGIDIASSNISTIVNGITKA